MGCGASMDVENDVQLASNRSVSPRLQSLQEQKHEHIPDLPAVTEMSSGTMNNVVISCHGDQKNLAEQLQKSLSNKNFACFVLSDTTPQSIIARANLIRWCDVFIVIISRSYQRTLFCMETINYAKDVQRPIITVLAERNFEPYGGLGAISASTAGSFVLDNGGISENIISQVANTISAQKYKKKNTRNIADPAAIENQTNQVAIGHGERTNKILICTVDDGAAVGALVSQEFLNKNLDAGLENLSKSNAVCSVRRCTVFVPMLTPQLEQSPIVRAAFDEARRLRKAIVPVIAIKSWKPEDWLGLAIAGITFFRISDQQTAYKPKYDSNRMTDLRVEVETACQPAPSQAERERKEIEVTKEKIEECRKQLKTWPPPRKERHVNPVVKREPVRVALEPPSAKLRFAHIHHTLTRMDMKAPTPLLDEYGFPKRSDIECMISYQWDNQPFVRQVYEDMSMRSIPTWFDIWGSMQGNTNEAMATGVECAKVLLVFLSKAYVESANCQLEFRYAVKRGKAFVLIRTESNIRLDQWMMEAIEGFPQYDVFSYEQLKDEINGVPTIDVILQSVRKLAQAQPADVINDCSAELYELRSLLDDVRDAISSESGQTRYKTCTRCNQQFDEYTKGGCKKHRIYYVGGSIIEGRWACCQQQSKDSPGCNPCDHTDAARVFTRDPSYGTSTWVPP